MKITLFRRRELWVPTWQGALILIGTPAICLAAALWLVYPVLSVNEPFGRGVLVVEGWMSKRQIQRTTAIYQEGSYTDLVVTGGPISDGSYLRELYPSLETFAEVGAGQLQRAGTKAIAVPRPPASKDRTYSSALALRKWLMDRQRSGYVIDVVSIGPHSRRSRNLFGAALTGVAEVGVIALEPSGYDPERWWRTSQGVRSVMSELLALGYATFIFWPDPERDLKELFKEGNAS